MSPKRIVALIIMVSVLVGLFGGCAAIFNMRRGFHFDNDELFASDTSKNTTISDVIKDSFDSIEVDGPINVVYKRIDGNYGLIEPD